MPRVFPAAPMLTPQQSRFTLFGEPLEDRYLLSANSPFSFAIQTVQTFNERACFAQVVAPSVPQSVPGVPFAEVAADGARPPAASAAYADPTGLPLTTKPAEPGNYPASPADNVGDGQMALLIAVQPDDSVDPFLDCPGLDGAFCLPSEIDFGLDIDLLDILIFGSKETSAASWRDSSFGGGARTEIGSLTPRFGNAVR